MPAKRLPWFRFWIDATSHGKVRQLDDATFRTWVELLDAAAKQPKRGRFESRREAVSVVRRPTKHIAALITAKLIDETCEGLVMHDWDEWQRWRAEDANDSSTSSESPPERLVNNSRTTPEEHTIDQSLRVRAEGDTDTEKELSTPLAPPGGQRKSARSRKPDRVLITEPEISGLMDKYEERYGGRELVHEEIQAALNHESRFKHTVERLYVDNWLRRELGFRENRPRPIAVVANGHVDQPPAAPRYTDNTGVRRWT